MKRSVVRSVGCAALLAVTPTVMYAHFRLLEPSSWLVEDARGDPQKAGPCGGTNADWGKPSYVVTKVTGGQKLHIRVQETIYHPGHYRVALAVNSPTELPRDPEVVTVDRADRGRESVSATIQDPPQTPVLADGLWVHKAKVEAPWETDVLLPNVSCRKCTLQVVQFMAEHGANNPGNYTYHHCADLQITADPAKPLDKQWPAARQSSSGDGGALLRAQAPAHIGDAQELRLRVEPAYTQPALRILRPGGLDSDRSIQVIFPEHVTVRRHGQMNSERLYVFSRVDTRNSQDRCCCEERDSTDDGHGRQPERWSHRRLRELPRRWPRASTGRHSLTNRAT